MRLFGAAVKYYTYDTHVARQRRRRLILPGAPGRQITRRRHSCTCSRRRARAARSSRLSCRRRPIANSEYPPRRRRRAPATGARPAGRPRGRGGVPAYPPPATTAANSPAALATTSPNCQHLRQRTRGAVLGGTSRDSHPRDQEMAELRLLRGTDTNQASLVKGYLHDFSRFGEPRRQSTLEARGMKFDLRTALEKHPAARSRGIERNNFPVLYFEIHGVHDPFVC